jgi:hypothetical protein
MLIQGGSAGQAAANKLIIKPLNRQDGFPARRRPD